MVGSVNNALISLHLCWSLIWETWKTLILTVFKYCTLFSGDFMPLKFKEITLKSLCVCINISNESALMSNPHMYIYIILICVTNWTRSPLSTIWYLKMVFCVCLDIYPEAFEALNNKTLAYTGWCPHHFPTCNQRKRKKLNVWIHIPQQIPLKLLHLFCDLISCQMQKWFEYSRLSEQCG